MILKIPSVTFNLGRIMPKTKFEVASDAELDDLLATKTDIAKCCKVSTRTVEKWVREKRIPYLRFGHRQLRFDARAVARDQLAFPARGRASRSRRRLAGALQRTGF